MVGRARVGCSGWSYRDWRGLVYPADLPASKWFGYYTLLFDTVELNNTFYRLPTQSAVEGWAAAAPPDFMYALKLGQFGSHRKKLRDAATWLPNHLDRAERLGASRGPTLVQLPPRWTRNAARLDEFLSVAPRTMRWAVEMRDPSWLHDEVYEVLARHGAALCIHDLIDDHPFVLTTDWTYVRFHGPDALRQPYRGLYGADRLAPVAARLQHELAAGHDVYCYFNNDFDGFAAVDAQWLRHAIDPHSRWG
ncbi:MAG: hypothetical protein JWM34_123 [Ilumatobacteraceae bacterium]|nr:hypothetical protein [Ilumatobacteraceae bacterium]